MIKAIIFDLDNTIYPVSSIGEELFYSLFNLIEKEGQYQGNLNEIKLEIMRRPFQLVASDYKFSKDLTEKCLNLLTNLTYNFDIKPFVDYEIAREIKTKKFLVTSGFKKMQTSKIENLGISNDFDKIYIVDPQTTNLVKKDFFIRILEEEKLQTQEVVVIGDDLNSEIKAGNELGLKTILYDFRKKYSYIENQIIITDYKELQKNL